MLSRSPKCVGGLNLPDKCGYFCIANLWPWRELARRAIPPPTPGQSPATDAGHLAPPPCRLRTQGQRTQRRRAVGLAQRMMQASPASALSCLRTHVMGIDGSRWSRPPGPTPSLADGSRSIHAFALWRRVSHERGLTTTVSCLDCATRSNSVAMHFPRPLVVSTQYADRLRVSPVGALF